VPLLHSVSEIEKRLTGYCFRPRTVLYIQVYFQLNAQLIVMPLCFQL